MYKSENTKGTLQIKFRLLKSKLTKPSLIKITFSYVSLEK